MPGMTYQVLQADARRLPLDDNSVDLVVTSPPYFALRAYKGGGGNLEGQIGGEPSSEGFLEALWDVAAESWRTLADSGSLWVNLGDRFDKNHATANGSGSGEVRTKSLMGLPWRYALGMIEDNGHAGGQWILRGEVIWEKTNGLPESATDRTIRKHEHWFHFVKEEVYFSAADVLRRFDPSTGDLGSMPTSVWRIPTEGIRNIPDGHIKHYAAFPPELPRRIILGWSPSGHCLECGQPRVPKVGREFTGDYNEKEAQRQKARSGVRAGGLKSTLGRTTSVTRRFQGEECGCSTTDSPTRPSVVLDPFGGTGTTAAVAHHLGRHGISVDLSPEYNRLARWRIKGDERLRARVLEATYGDNSLLGWWDTQQRAQETGSNGCDA